MQKCSGASALQHIARRARAIGFRAPARNAARRRPRRSRAQPRRRRKALGHDCAIDHGGDDLHAARGEVDLAGAILAGEIKQRPALCFVLRAEEREEIGLVAVGGAHIAKAGGACGLRAAASHREDRERGKRRAAGMGCNGAGSIGAGHRHGAVGRVGDGAIDRFDAQQRRQQHLVAARAQRGGGARAVGSGRVTSTARVIPRRRIGAGAGLELAAASAPRRIASPVALARGLEQRATVRLKRSGHGNAGALAQHGVASDRRAAGTVEHRQERALGGERRQYRRDRSPAAARRVAVAARLDGDDPCPTAGRNSSTGRTAVAAWAGRAASAGDASKVASTRRRRACADASRHCRVACDRKIGTQALDQACRRSEAVLTVAPAEPRAGSRHGG
jgi:hypothetical protein